MDYQTDYQKKAMQIKATLILYTVSLTVLVLLITANQTARTSNLSISGLI